MSTADPLFTEEPLLSPQQLRARAQQLERHSGYRLVLELRGPVDAARVQRAVAECIAIHDALRLRIGGAHPFESDLATTSDGRTLLTLTAGACNADPQSLAILARAVPALYGALGRRTEPNAPCHAAFVAWAWEILGDSSAGAAARDIERSVDEMRDPALPLACLSSPEHAPDDSQVVDLTLSDTLVRQLQAYCTGHRLELQAALMAGWLLTLDKLGGGDTVRVATLVEGRVDESLRDAVGLFSFFAPVTPVPTVGSFLELARNTARELERLASWHSWPSIPLTPGPRFPGVGFEFVDLGGSLLVCGVSFTPVEMSAQADRFYLRLQCVQAADHLRLQLRHDPRVYDAEQANRVLQSFVAILQRSVSDPGASVAAHSCVDESECPRLIAQGPSDETVSGLDVLRRFADTVRAFSASAAVRQGSQSLSYAELADRSDRVARSLRARGVGEEDRVGVLAEPGPHALIAIWGVLKAGAAYVPLDPSYPAARLEFMANDAGVRLILATPMSRPKSPSGAALLDIEDAQSASAQALLPKTVHPLSAAYVLYTSGSTGRPKGVVVTHGGLANYVEWCLRTYGFAAGKAASVHASLAFDLVITSIFPTLLCGGYVLFDDAVEPVEGSVGLLLHGEGISVAKLTPAHLRLVQQRSPSDTRASVDALVIGGEALWAEHVEFWREASPQTRIFNEYGPTETVVGCCVHESPPGVPIQGRVPIGRPLRNTRLYVLDRDLNLVPPDASGELFIAGAGVARGYLGRADLTAERFLPDPFGPRGSRMYRSGDMVVQSRDGVLTYLGRRDQQVKIRGRRVELAEIESALVAHPAVKGAAAALIEHEGAERLAVYLVPADDAERRGLSATGLRDFLRKTLPEFMIPPHFVTLAALPLTANGKLDRAQLPRLSDASLLRERYVPPAGLEEEILAAIWCQILGLERVGNHDNYFSLGGDSIRSVEIVALAQERGLSLTIDQLFRFPTIQTLAAELREAKGEHEQTPQLAPFALLKAEDAQRIPEGIVDAYPLTQLQAGMIYHRRAHPGSAVYHDISSIHVAGHIDTAVLERAVRATLKLHPALRTRFDFSSYSEPLQLVHDEGPLGLEIVDLRGNDTPRQVEAIEAWIANEKQRGFVEEQLPLVRMAVHLRTEQTFQFSISFHHALMDGWSEATLLTESFARYWQMRRGEPADMRPPATSFRDYVWLERESLVRADSREFWMAELANVRPCRLPRWRDVDRSRVAREISTCNVPIPEDVSRGLKKLAVQAAVPLKSVLLAVHMRVMAFLTGQSDIVSCVVSSGRPETRDGERAIGLFINSLPFRLRISPSASWLDLVASAFERERVCLPHRRLPLAQIQNILSCGPLSECLFYYTHYHIYQRLAELGDVQGLDYTIYEQTSFTLSANFSLNPLTAAVSLNLKYDCEQLSAEQVSFIAGCFSEALGACATDMYARASAALMPANVRTSLVEMGHGSRVSSSTWSPLHSRILQRANGNDTAVVGVEEELSYAELIRRSRLLAGQIVAAGVQPEDRVAVLLPRSCELVVAYLAVLESGAVLVPIAAGAPPERVKFMLADSGAKRVITRADVAPDELPIPVLSPRVAAAAATQAPASSWGMRVVHPESAAYVIYTSGSTGVPKGVQVSHGSLANFAAGISERVPAVEGDRLLAVTAVGFDISLLELLWSLSRGMRVAIYAGDPTEAVTVNADGETDAALRRLQFSLLYFAAEDSSEADKYSLLLQTAQVADRNGFEAIWLPERHFHAFGGLYPNPAVLAAALATRTTRIGLRAGSVVWPLHHPARVVEEWSVVDNLSNGRVGLSLASGWNQDDFILSGASFARRRQQTYEGFDLLRRLWRGESATLRAPDGGEIAVRTFPRPKQESPPLWLTSAGNVEVFEGAGRLGVRLLTHLLGQDLETLAEKIRRYRGAFAAAGHDVRNAHVTLALHTFVAADFEAAKPQLRGPLRAYLRSSVSLVEQLARHIGRGSEADAIDEQERAVLIEHAMDRYMEEAGLIGSPERCQETLRQLARIGVDEIASLVDFGASTAAVMQSLSELSQLKDRIRAGVAPLRASIPDAISRYGITHLQCTPSLAALLLEMPGGRAALRGLRTLMVGGEPLPVPLAAQLREAVGGEVVNLYGPTETTIWSSTYDVKDAAAVMTVGKPIANTQFYVTDEDLELLPVGAIGELCIGGAGLARGYVGRPDTTAERFVPDPFGATAGKRLYRTGDLAYRRVDGNVVILGRRDTQIKIRGHRIELEEIEASVRTHPAIERCFVAAVEGATGGLEIVAFVQATEMPTAAVMRAFLARRLPDAMIPAQLIPLAEFPLTAHGKIDRDALRRVPRPAVTAPVGAASAPGSPLQELVAEVWSEVLKIDAIDRDQDFFDAGGHSVLATQAVARLSSRTGMKLSVKLLLDNPTVASLAAALEREMPAARATPAIVSGIVECVLSPRQHQMWQLDRALGGALGLHMPLLLDIHGPFDEALLQMALQEVAQRHGALRSRFFEQQGQVRLRVMDTAHVDWSVHDLSALQPLSMEQQVAKWIEEESRKPFDLEKAAWRASLARVGKDARVLLLTFHHLIFDGPSRPLFLEEVSRIYEARARAAEPCLPPVAEPSTAAIGVERDLQTASTDRYLARIRQAAQHPALSLSRPSKLDDQYRQESVEWRGSDAWWEGIARLASELDCEAADLYRTAFAAALGSRSARSVLLAIAVSGRSTSAPVIGCLVDHVPACIDLSGDPTFRDLRERTRKASAEAFRHQGVSLAQLIAQCPLPIEEGELIPLSGVVVAPADGGGGQLGACSVSGRWIETESLLLSYSRPSLWVETGRRIRLRYLLGSLAREQAEELLGVTLRALELMREDLSQRISRLGSAPPVRCSA